MNQLFYAILKDNLVVNTIAISENNLDVIDDIVQNHDADTAVEIPNFALWAMHIGAEYDGEFFIITNKETSPFPSWSWEKETGTWVAPTPYPNDENFYYWDEEELVWKI
jgi:hypothetical protein